MAYRSANGCLSRRSHNTQCTHEICGMPTSAEVPVLTASGTCRFPLPSQTQTSQQLPSATAPQGQAPTPSPRPATSRLRAAAATAAAKAWMTPAPVTHHHLVETRSDLTVQVQTRRLLCGRAAPKFHCPSSVLYGTQQQRQAQMLCLSVSACSVMGQRLWQHCST